MASNLHEAIIALLADGTARKAGEIASHLKVSRTDVNAALYGALRGKVTQVAGYKWTLVTSAGKQRGAGQSTENPNKYAAIFRYYLDCLASDAGISVSVFAESKFDLDYALLPALPIDTDCSDWASTSGVDRLIARQRRESRTKTLWLGWPVMLRNARSRTGWSGNFVEPVILWPLDVEADNLSFVNEPLLNMKVLERLCGDANPLEEAAELAEELGLDLPEDIDAADIGARLAAIRPEWPWAERLDTDELSTELPELDGHPAAIFNRAAIVLAEREPFTVGLEGELRTLQTVADNAIETSALGVMIAGAQAANDLFNGPILEVAPLNAEQRDAVRGALSAPLTVITGPPGTGKSQVVTAIIVNAAYHGMKVLFASKNNKAVDVVEERVNGLAARPVLMRLGGRAPREGLADRLTAILSERSDDSQRENIERAGIEVVRIGQALFELDNEIERIRNLRNATDEAERKSEAVRVLVGEEKFATLRSFNGSASSAAVDQLQQVAIAADRSQQNLIVRLIWPLVRNGRLREFEDATRGLGALGSQLAVGECPNDPTAALGWCNELHSRIRAALDAAKYHDLRSQLSTAGDLANLTRTRVRLLDELATASTSAWEGWLTSLGERLTAAERKALGDYVALLRSIANTQETGGQISRQIWARYYSLAAQVANVLPGWAVTSLSAKGRVPFDSGLFDVVVIDEASQCDIASVLPLLYRAKRAVVIGDPQQLRHISKLSSDKDQAFMVRHGILDQPGPAWSYRAVSLYELAAGRVPAEAVISLRDHHRSHEAIIRFANDEFYSGGLRVATNYSRLLRHGQPALRWVNVEGNVVRPADGGAVNEPEAREVIKELKRLVLDQRYPGSIGVVTPFRAQARRIREMIAKDNVLSTVLAAREFLSETAHKFQGDERDLIIFSPVVSKGVSEGALGFLRKSGNLFNVAITRGRASVVTIGDKLACLRSNVPYLERFAIYCDEWQEDTADDTHRTVVEPSLSPNYPAVAHPELVSDWEHVFYDALFSAGIASVPQYDIDQYILDFALFSDDGRKLNVEIDGERYHREWNGDHVRRDQLRDMRLMEMGWDVRRFWVYQVRDEMDRCVEVIRDWMTTNKPS